MKKLFTLRSIFSLALLLIGVSALGSGLKLSIRDAQDAAFFPVAAFAVTLSYALGFSSWSTRHVWSVILISGFLVAFVESARLVEPIKIFLQAIPQFELDFLRWAVDKKVPDSSLIQTQFTEIIKIASALTSRMLSASVDHPSVREVFWDIPSLLLAAWAGWGTGRRNQTLLALAPSLIFHAFILNYTGKDALSLQIAVFAFILLVGINQTWSIAQEKSENSERASRETYSAIILLSIALAIIAGIMPSISAKEIAQKLTGKDALAKSIGLEREIAQAYAISGLPRQHLIGLSPRLSQMVIFTVKTGELEPSENAILTQAVPRHYWRWLTYDIYNGQGWATSPVKNVSYSPNQLLFSISSDGYQVIHQSVEKALPQDTRLYLTGYLASVTEPFNASWRTRPGSQPENIDSFPGVDMLGAVTENQKYQADSIIPIVSADLLRASSQLYPQEIRSRYLALPETIPQRVRSLARELTANAANPYDKAKAIETYLREYPYTLDLTPPPPNRDIVDYFLFDLKKGYCDYYATSMIVLARAAGLPARLVIGYATGIYDPLKAEYVIHESDAHSWVEIYFAGAGWVEFEPTASQLRITLPDELPREIISPIIPFPIPSEHQVIAYAKGRFFPRTDLIPLVIGLTSMIIFSCSWFLRAQGLFKSHTTIGSIYKYVFYHGKKIYTDAPTHETPSIFANSLIKRLRSGYSWLIPAANEIKYLTDLYIQETFSPHPITRNERARAVKVWRKLFWRLLYARAVRL